jgi:hypothetical protein
MARSSLRLRFHDDGDGTGKLLAQAEANGFAGTSGAYFDKQRLSDFARALEAFPLVGRVRAAAATNSDKDATGS